MTRGRHTSWLWAATRRLLLAGALLIVASFFPPARAYAAHDCTVRVYPSTASYIPAGYGVLYALGCNFKISGYTVTNPDRFGNPRAAGAFGWVRHAPSFSCNTDIYSANPGFRSKEWGCRHYTVEGGYRTYNAPTVGTGNWSVAPGYGAAVCSSPRLRFSFRIWDATETTYVDRGPISVTRCPGDSTSSSGPDLSLTRAEVAGYIREMIDDNTRGRVRRLRSGCRRTSYRSMRCRLSWRIRRSRYRGRATIWHYLKGGEVYWTYEFRGTRRKAGCSSCFRRLRW